ncbi:MAG: PhoH family protein [Saprospiraceae bacterium]|nr:PhoH family protein [Saprospiraceae bacterium]
MAKSEIVLNVDAVDPIEFYGANNSHLELIKAAFPELQITSRGSKVVLSGEKKRTQKAKRKVEMMVRLLRENQQLNPQIVQDLLHGSNPFDSSLDVESSASTIVHGRTGKPIKAKTRNQKRMVELAMKHDVLFAIGPAGTGKTYTAVALAVRAMKNKLVKKIILTRPAVEAGESLGFLPGDMKEKVDPYLRPLYDALDDMIPMDKLRYFMEHRIIEVAPLAFMRGRTLDNAYVILDEAQNCTSVQIKMFLTRLGPSAKCIVTGDMSQIDLPGHNQSGLPLALRLLGDLDGIGVIELGAEDVVRHRLVKQVIRAYDRHYAKRRSHNEEE